MGKGKQHKKNLVSTNGQPKSIGTDAAANNRAKKRGVPYSTDEHAGDGNDVPSAKRTKKASEAPNASGWLVESGVCHPSKEGNTSNCKPKPACNMSRKKASPSTALAKLPTVAYKRKDPPIDYYDSDDTEDEFGSGSNALKLYAWLDGASSCSNDSSFGEEDDSGSFDEDELSDSLSYESDSFDDDSSSSSCNNYQKYIYGEEHYDSADDKDFEASIDSDTVRVPLGSAVMHDITDGVAKFDPSCPHGQIIELPMEHGLKESEKSTDATQTQNVVEEKELDDVESDESSAIRKPAPKTPTHSGYTFHNAVDTRMSLVVLQTPIYMYGHLSVQVLCGKIEMLGYTLDAGEKRTVYGSEGYNAINITPVPSPTMYNKAAFVSICEKLKPHFIASDMHALATQFDPAKSVLVLLRADTFKASDTVPLVCKLLPDFNLFPTSLVLDEASPFSATEILLEIALFPPEVKNVPLFQPNPVWDEVQLKPDSRLMVVGGKGSGKSTLCQYLINRHIKHFGRVLLVDLDIGQPLLFLPETISASVVQEPILGVGCFMNVQPRKCQLFGSLNVVSSPLLYVQNVRSLVQHCAEHPELKGMPWIINTMGYVVGFGEELTTAIVRLVQPTDLVQLTYPKVPKKASPFNKTQNYANQLKAEVVNEFRFNILDEEVKLQSNPVAYRFYSFDVTYDPCGASFFPPRRRTITIMAQLVKVLGDTAESFADVKPHVAHLEDLQILITRDEHRPSKEMLLPTLNATLVYLCERGEKGQFNCFGVGIVRSVDEKQNVYLLHSLPPEQLARTNVLALCNTSLPGQVYLQPSPNIEGTIPYLQNVSDATK